MVVKRILRRGKKRVVGKKDKEFVLPEGEEDVLPNAPEQDIEEHLRTIYQATEDELPDLSRLDQVRSYRWFWGIVFGVSLIMTLIGSAWAGFFFMNRGLFGIAAEQELNLEIEGATQIVLGEEVTYFFHYRNTRAEPLTDLKVYLNFPKDFEWVGRMPEPAEGSEYWMLGSLAAGERGTITVRGKFRGPIESKTSIQAVASYRPENREVEQESMKTINIEYAGSVLQLEMDVPERAIPGESTAMNCIVTNTTDQMIEGVVARIRLPEGFIPEPASMEKGILTDGVFRTVLPGIEAGGFVSTTIEGTFASGFGGDAVVVTEIGGEPDGSFLAMQKIEKVFPVMAGDLSLMLVVNGSDNPERIFGYGETIRAIIGYENTANEPLKKVSLTAIAETVPFKEGVGTVVNALDWEKVTTSATSTVKNGRVLWKWEDNEELEEVAPYGSGNVELVLPVAEAVKDENASVIQLTVFAEIGSVGKSELNREIRMKPMRFILLSDATLNAEARYFTEEGAPMGSGPLPPQVGTTTRYRIVWDIQKKVHELKDLRVSGILPRSVQFAGIASTTAGELNWDEKTRSVSWSLNRLPADVDSAEMQFNVELEPSLANEGRYADLMDEITFEAGDVDIGESVLRLYGGLNTDLQNDEYAEGKGVVTK